MGEDVGTSERSGDQRGLPPRLWWSRRAVALHLTLAVVLPLFAVCFVWQVNRVRQGNELSWAYVFEWPFFAAYAVYLWWRLLHDQLETPAPPASSGAVAARASSRRKVGAGASAPSREPEEDAELAAYNRYLAQLNATGRRKHW